MQFPERFDLFTSYLILISLSRPSLDLPIPCLMNTRKDERKNWYWMYVLFEQQLIDTPINVSILTILLLKIVSLWRNSDCCFWYCGTWPDLNIDPVRSCCWVRRCLIRWVNSLDLLYWPMTVIKLYTVKDYQLFPQVFSVIESFLLT